MHGESDLPVAFPAGAVYRNALGHVNTLLGGSLVVEITPNVVKRYQADRLNEKAGPKTINDEVQLLIRLCGEAGCSNSRSPTPR
ncbi:MAG: hypothetical protein M3Z23_14715 [Acidobacteriota bacterium]|nr:hypothetical protein [Acidobacteriota bacterium]